MNIVIFYFSGTGNTWWAANQLKSELEALSNDVAIYSLENAILKTENFVTQKIAKAQQVIIAYPIYGSSLPENMDKFINNLPSCSNDKNFTVLCTQQSFSGDGTTYFKKVIEKKGYKFQQSFQINMTTNFNVALVPFCFSKPASGKKLEKIKTKASNKIKKMASVITSGKQYIEGNKFHQILLGRFQRYFFTRKKKKLLTYFNFFSDRCKKCKLCANTCPTNNITMEIDDNGVKLQRGNNCILCFRCYNFCPSAAINYGKNIKDPEKYQRYKGPVEKLDLNEIRT